MFRLRDKK